MENYLDAETVKKDIENRTDIELLVDSFYGKVKKDPLIGPVFIGVIRDNWPAHLEKMYRFWETVLLEKYSYKGSPFAPHAQMPLDKRHFNSWLQLFTETVDEHFSGKKADEAKWRANRMATMFQAKIQHLRTMGGQNIL